MQGMISAAGPTACARSAMGMTSLEEIFRVVDLSSAARFRAGADAADIP